MTVPGKDVMEDTSGVSRAAFDFIDEIERMSDPRSLMLRLDSELKRYGFHA